MSRFNQATPIPRQGIAESFDTPGIVPQPGVSPGAEQAQQLIDALDAGTESIGVAADVLRQQQRIDERFRKEQEALDAGLASRHARLDLPELNQQVQKGELMPGEGEDPSDFAVQVVEERTEGMPEAYRQRYSEMIAPRLTDAILDKRQRVQREADQEHAQLTLENIASSDSPEQIGEAVQAFSNLTDDRYDQRDIERAVLVPALETAATQGDEQRFQWIKDRLGDRFPDAQQEAETALQRARQQRQTAANDRLEQQFNRLIERPNWTQEQAENLIDGSDATSVQRNRMRRQLQSIQERRRGVTHDRHLDTLLDTARNGPDDLAGFSERVNSLGNLDPSDPRALSHNEIQKVRGVLDDQFLARQQATVNERAFNAAMNGRLDTITGDVRVQTPSGEARTLSVDRPAVMRQVDQAIRQQTFSEIAGVPLQSAEEMSDGERSMAENLSLLRQTRMRKRNGQFDGAAASQLNSLGKITNPTDFIETGRQDGFTEEATAWFHRFRAMEAVEPTFVEEALDNDAYRFWRNAKTFFELSPDVDTPQKAMLRAAQAEKRMLGEEEPFSAMTEAEFSEHRESVIRDFWFSIDPSMEDIKNRGEVEQRLFELASAKKQATGLSSAEALKQSAKDLRSKHIAVNGYLMFVGDERLPAQIRQGNPADRMRRMTRFAARRFVEQNPDSDITENNAVLRPMPGRRGLWVLQNGNDPPGSLPLDEAFDGQTAGDGLPTAAFTASEINELFEANEQVILDGAVGDLSGREFDAVFEDRLERAGLTTTTTVQGMIGPFAGQTFSRTDPTAPSQLTEQQRAERQRILRNLVERYQRAGLGDQIPGEVRRELGMEGGFPEDQAGEMSRTLMETTGGF